MKGPGLAVRGGEVTIHKLHPAFSVTSLDNYLSRTSCKIITILFTKYLNLDVKKLLSVLNKIIKAQSKCNFKCEKVAN